jgi:opacity protein-like surface antigen
MRTPGRRGLHRLLLGSAAFLGLISLPGFTASAGAQSLGLGPRLSLVRGEVDAGTSAERFTGGTLRARLSPRSALELSLDYRSTTNELATERVREYPFQGSLLLYPVRANLSPYVLGGLGWYSQRVDALVNDKVDESATTRRFGYHAGLGGEIRLGRHAAMHVDYRYTFIRFNADDETAASGAGTAAGASGGFRIPGVSYLTDQLHLSHGGSMWTGGVTIYF